MTLQVALLLIGAVIVTVVALSSFDRARLNRRYLKDGAKPSIKIVAKEALSLIDRTFKSVSNLDLNPSPFSYIKKRSLRSADGIPVLEVTADDHMPTFRKDMESLEEAASIAIDVDPNIAQSVTSGGDDFGADGTTGTRTSIQTRPDVKIDFIVDFPGKKAVTRNKALGVYKQNEYMLEKSRALYGLRFVDRVWSNLDSDPETMQYSDLAVAIQLLDGKGPIDESELNTFGQMALKMADALKRRTRMAETFEQAVDQANNLDEFCREYDAIAGINLVPDEGQVFSAADIKSEATEAGLVFGAMNIFHKKNQESKGCRHMFSLANLFDPGEFDPNGWATQTAKGLALFMQIPTTYDPVFAFEEMVSICERLCDKLGATAVDQDGKPLSTDNLNIIKKQIAAMAAGMRERGIVPGSETALRLFNS